ncbi:MAG: sensor histidine kinase [Acidobacteriota bacterium]
MSSFTTLFGLTGFFTGFALYLFFFWTVLERRNKEKFHLALLCLLGSLLLWYVGNFVSLLLRQMDTEKVARLLGAVDSVSFLSLAVLPALLLHTHWLYYGRSYAPARWERRILRPALVSVYVPLLFLPLVVSRLFPATGAQPLQRLGVFTTPFLAMLALSYYGSCLVQAGILRQSRNPIERAVFQKLLILFLLIPLFNFYVFWGGGSDQPVFGPFWTLLALLASVPPTLVVTYYIFRYQFLRIIVQRGLPTLLLILVTLSVYLVGVRRLTLYLEEEFGAPALLLEGLFLVAVMLLFPPLSRWLGSRASRLFSGRARQLLELAERLHRTAPSLLDPLLLKEFIQETLAQELHLPRVRIHLREDLPIPVGEGFHPLQAGDRVIGYLEMPLPGLEASVGAAGAVRLLSNQIASALERTQLLESKLRMERELDQKSYMEELGRMAATLAHNLKNPLSSIKTLMQLLREAPNLSSEQHHEVGMMIREVDRLTKTITKLLRFSRLENPPDAADMSLAGVDLNHLVESLRTVFRGEMEARRVVLRTRVELTGSSIVSNADILSETIGNLLSNALEASEPGGKIQLWVGERDGQIEIRVEDDGPGIPPKVRDRIFRPFVTTKTSGTGLGLAIVSKRISQLGGSIRFESPLNDGGTRFIVRLPRIAPGGIQ